MIDVIQITAVIPFFNSQIRNNLAGTLVNQGNDKNPTLTSRRMEWFYPIGFYLTAKSRSGVFAIYPAKYFIPNRVAIFFGKTGKEWCAQFLVDILSAINCISLPGFAGSLKNDRIVAARSADGLPGFGTKLLYISVFLLIFRLFCRLNQSLLWNTAN